MEKQYITIWTKALTLSKLGKDWIVDLGGVIKYKDENYKRSNKFYMDKKKKYKIKFSEIAQTYDVTEQTLRNYKNGSSKKKLLYKIMVLHYVKEVKNNYE